MEIKLDEIVNIIENFDQEEKIIFKQKSVEMRFIKNLILERKKRGLSQRELAYKSGLTQQAISSLEKCDRKPTLTNLIKYLLGLGIDINILFDR